MKKKFRFPLWVKTLIVLILSVSLVSVVAIVFSANTFRTITRNHYVEHSTELADTLGIYLNLDDVKTIKAKVEERYKSIDESLKVENSDWGSQKWEDYLSLYSDIVEMPEYGRLFKQIETFHSKNDAKYMYLAYADFEDKRLIYLVDDSVPEERCLPGSFDAFTETDMSITEHIDEGFTPEITNMPEYGYLVSVGRPIFDADHNLVAFALVDLSMDAIIAKENQNTTILIIILILLSLLAVTGGFLLVLFVIIRPIRKLTKAANEYIEEKGEHLNKFNQINIRTADEIEDLSNSMKKMENDISGYINDLLSTTTKLEGAEKTNDELKHLVIVDALTGVNNKRAYFEAEERLNEEIQKGKAKFAISMIDLNDLKTTNDTLGHEIGDNFIIALSNIIKKVFTASSIYRIGGDEFTVISEGKDFKNIEKLEQDFIASIKESLNNTSKDAVHVSAAIGVAIYNPIIDNNVEDTFKRADKKMYQNKKMIKEKR